MGVFIHATIALCIRLCLIVISEIQDKYSVVKYTDIDYHVFTDAARYMYENNTPYSRHTYRYTPLLAFLLCPNIFFHEAFGKLLFSVFDVITGVLIYYILLHNNSEIRLCKMGSNLWLYNPICAIISTRGSSDSLMTALIMTCLFFFQRKSVILSALTYGLAIHFKLYPCIFALSFYFALSKHLTEKGSMNKFCNIVSINKAKLCFTFFTICGFIIPTVISYIFYGMKYIDEALLYHITRKDIRHNFSPYFYYTYLSEYYNGQHLFIPSVLPFFVQLVLLMLTSWTFGMPQTLPSCLFIQTYIFVTFNKVCTSQYFLWYLSLFPLTMPILNMRLFSIIKLLCLWFTGQILWLIPAYFLEFESKNCFVHLWISSLIMFLLNVYLLNNFCKLCLLKLNVIKYKIK